MSTFDIYLIIFLIGGLVIGSMVYSGVKGLLSVMNRFHTPGYPMYGAPSMPAFNNRQPAATDNSMVNWLLFITICLATYSLLSEADIEAIISHFEKNSIEAPASIPESPKKYESSDKKTFPQISHNKKTKEALATDSTTYSKKPITEEFFLQLVASSRLQKIQKRGRKYQSFYSVRIGIGTDQYPFKLLVGPFDSEEAILNFQEKHPKLRNKWIRNRNEFRKVVLVES